jgi:hypothetical protein
MASMSKKACGCDLALLDAPRPAREMELAHSAKRYSLSWEKMDLCASRTKIIFSAGVDNGSGFYRSSAAKPLSILKQPRF